MFEASQLDALFDALQARGCSYQWFAPAQLYESTGLGAGRACVAYIDGEAREVYYARFDDNDVEVVRVFSAPRDKMGKIEWLPFPEGYNIPMQNCTLEQATGEAKVERNETAGVEVNSNPSRRPE